MPGYTRLTFRFPGQSVTRPEAPGHLWGRRRPRSCVSRSRPPSMSLSLGHYPLSRPRLIHARAGAGASLRPGILPVLELPMMG